MNEDKTEEFEPKHLTIEQLEEIYQYLNYRLRIEQDKRNHSSYNF